MKDNLEETILTIEKAIETTKKTPRIEEEKNFKKGVLFGLEWALGIAKECKKWRIR